MVVLSDGATNQGEDPVAAARALGVPVHAVVIGDPLGSDRAVAELDASPTARVGELAPVRVHVTSSEPRGTPLSVRLEEDGRELGRGTALAAGPGAEATTEIRVMPSRPGLALWRARVDSLPGEITTENNARSVAIEVAPSRLGVPMLRASLNWDLTFIRRALTADWAAATARARERDGWRSLDRAIAAARPMPRCCGGDRGARCDRSASVPPEFTWAPAGFCSGGGSRRSAGFTRRDALAACGGWRSRGHAGSRARRATGCWRRRPQR